MGCGDVLMWPFGGDNDAPPPPENIDVSKVTLDYIMGITDPKIQERLLGFERSQREQWRELGLKDIWQTTFGPGTQPQGGTIDILERILPRTSRMQAQALSAQREGEVSDIERLGPRITEALRASDPAMQKLLAQQGALTNRAYGMAERVTPQQQRMAEQQARAAGASRGRAFGQGTIAAEILGREDVLAQRRNEAQQSGAGYFQMLKQTSADPSMVLFGRPGYAYGGATQQQGVGIGTAQSGGMFGPQLIDPNTGLNLALAQQSNLSNYNASIYGAQQAKQGQMLGGLFSAFGSIGSSLFGG